MHTSMNAGGKTHSHDIREGRVGREEVGDHSLLFF